MWHGSQSGQNRHHRQYASQALLMGPVWVNSVSSTKPRNGAAELPFYNTLETKLSGTVWGALRGASLPLFHVLCMQSMWALCASAMSDPQLA